MRHVLKMTLGVCLVLFGLVGLLAKAGIVISLLLVAAGAVVLRLSYSLWKEWYDQRNSTMKHMSAMSRDLNRKANTVVNATIIGSDSKANTGSAIGRAVVGDLVAGGVGSIVGASTAKRGGMTKFLVEFADGHKAVETVKDNSLRFQELIKYVQR